MSKPGRKNAYDRVRIIVEMERAAQHAGFSAIGAPPQPIADYRYRSEAEREVLGTE